MIGPNETPEAFMPLSGLPEEPPSKQIMYSTKPSDPQYWWELVQHTAETHQDTPLGTAPKYPKGKGQSLVTQIKTGYETIDLVYGTSAPDVYYKVDNHKDGGVKGYATCWSAPPPKWVDALHDSPEIKAQQAKIKTEPKYNIVHETPTSEGFFPLDGLDDLPDPMPSRIDLFKSVALYVAEKYSNKAWVSAVPDRHDGTLQVVLRVGGKPTTQLDFTHTWRNWKDLIDNAITFLENAHND